MGLCRINGDLIGFDGKSGHCMLQSGEHRRNTHYSPIADREKSICRRGAKSAEWREVWGGVSLPQPTRGVWGRPELDRKHILAYFEGHFRKLLAPYFRALLILSCTNAHRTWLFTQNLPFPPCRTALTMKYTYYTCCTHGRVARLSWFGVLTRRHRQHNITTAYCYAELAISCLSNGVDNILISAEIW